MIKIHQPVGYSKVGGREHNEDAIYPAAGRAGTQDAFFMVCDGVGGAQKGEIASSLITHAFPRYVAADGAVHGTAFYQAGLQQVEDHLSAHIQEHPDCRGMASTITMLHIRERDVVLGWAGDSRIYHIRDGRILFRSKDHSLVNKLVQMGEISEAEAQSHPQRNVIVRAVKGRSEPTQLDVQVISDVQAGDFFLLCTDGVLETFQDDQVRQWFGAKQSPQEIADRLLEQAAGATHDNYSAYLIKVAQGTGVATTRASGMMPLFRWAIPILLVINIGLVWNWLRATGYFEPEEEIEQPLPPPPQDAPSRIPAAPRQDNPRSVELEAAPDPPAESPLPNKIPEISDFFPSDTTKAIDGINIQIEFGQFHPDSAQILMDSLRRRNRYQN